MDTNVITALIGAFSGILGAVIGAISAAKSIERNDYLLRKNEELKNRKYLVERYLYQLYEAINSLMSRIDNLENRNGRVVMDKDYYVKSTLYALGNVWAYERIFLFDGIYYELDRIEQGAGSNLFSMLKKFTSRPGFSRYYRLSLAEILINLEEDHHRVLPYLEFHMRLQDPRYQTSLEPVLKWMEKGERLDPEDNLPYLEAETKRLLNVVGETDKYSKIGEKGT